MTTTNETTLQQARDRLVARARELSDKLPALRNTRGGSALKAALGDAEATKHLDLLDTEIAAAEREQEDIDAAVIEVDHQIREFDLRETLDKAKEAAKKLPAATKQYQAALAKVEAALQVFGSAWRDAAKVASQGTELFEVAAPMRTGMGDAYSRQCAGFGIESSLHSLVDQVASKEADAFRQSVTERFAEHIESKAQAQAAQADAAIVYYEQRIKDARNPPNNAIAADSRTVSQVWPNGQRQTVGQSFVEAYGSGPKVAQVQEQAL